MGLYEKSFKGYQIALIISMVPTFRVVMNILFTDTIHPLKNSSATHLQSPNEVSLSKHKSAAKAQKFHCLYRLNVVILI